MSDEQQVFGLPVGWVLNEDETPLEVLGVVKYLDAEGSPNYYVFNSEGITEVEAMGMCQYLLMQCKDDLQTAIYMSCTVGDIGDDDDD